MPLAKGWYYRTKIPPLATDADALSSVITGPWHRLCCDGSTETSAHQGDGVQYCTPYCCPSYLTSYPDRIIHHGRSPLDPLEPPWGFRQ